MNRAVSFTVPGKPKGKGRPRHTRDGHTYTPEATVKYENLIAYCAAKAMGGRPPIEGPLCLAMIAYVEPPKSWPAKRRAMALFGLEVPTTKPDGDNILKTVDAANGLLFTDDKQIAEWFIRKLFGSPARLEVRVKPYFDTAFAPMPDYRDNL